MDREAMEQLDAYRLGVAGPLENSLIDDLAEGEIDRATFVRHASMLGLSVSVVGSALAALGGAHPAFAAPVAARVGGRLRLGVTPPPAAAIEPHNLAELGELITCGIAGEYLTRSVGTLKPELAVSWKANKNASVWTFKLRKGVRFANGAPCGADDVVATYKRLVSEKVNPPSAALSALKGVLSSGGIRKIDNFTVAFHLDTPTASFPYLTSSTTYQAIILPKTYKIGTFTETPQTTGAFAITSYTPGVGATYDRNESWWGGKAPLDGVDVTYYADSAAATAALLGRQVDLLNQIQVLSARALLNNPKVQIFKAHGATHREVIMAVDMDENLRDYRVRQAIALTLDRPGIVKKLFAGLADVGNDSPFAPVFPSTAKVPQRSKNIALAKKLMAQAGKERGFKVTLTTEKVGEIPALAAIVKESAKQIDVDIALKIITVKAYFAGTYEGGAYGLGNTPWLNTPMNITDWNHRAVPNVYLTSSLVSGGVWNAAHYKNAAFDKLVKSYTGAVALSDQRKYARQLQTILLRDTPQIYPYFYNYLTAGAKNVKGYETDPATQVYLSRTSLA